MRGAVARPAPQRRCRARRECRLLAQLLGRGAEGALRIGWIGCGTHAAEMLLPHLARLDTKLVALCDTDEARVAKIAGSYGVPAQDCHADARALLARKDIDAIGMAIGPRAHLELGVAALARGLPVFMEKPPGAKRPPRNRASRWRSAS
jgi:hypothetical protein